MKFRAFIEEHVRAVVENLAVFYSDINNFRMSRRFVTYYSAKGFTLIELVIVIAIIGILASLSFPRFMDLSGAAQASATRAGLGSVRSVLAIRYAASATGGATASYPGTLANTDFAGNELPRNALNNFSGVTALTGTTTGTATHASLGYWYVSHSTSTNYGKSGAYSNGTIDTSTY